MTKKTLRTISSALGLVLLAAVYVSQQGSPPQNSTAKTLSEHNPGLYSIDHFVDGDTIAVKMNGKAENIRMIGIDTPETHKPNSPVQCYGPAASAYMRHRVGTQQVRLESDPKSTNRDRYNRLLRYVYLPDGTLLEADLIKNGYGFAYTQFPFEKSTQFEQYQADARKANKGLWANCQPYQQSNGRWQTEDQKSAAAAAES